MSMCVDGAETGEVEGVLLSYSAAMVRRGFLLNTQTVQSGDFFALFRVFPEELWATLLGVSVAIVVILGLNDWAFDGQPRGVMSAMGEATWTVVTFITDQINEVPQEFHKRTETTRALLASLGLTSLFMLTLYESGLLSVLIRENKRLPFTSTAQLAPLIKDDTYELIAHPDHFYLRYVALSTRPTIIAMQEALHDESPIQETKLEERLRQTKEEHNRVMPTDELLGRRAELSHCGLRFVADPDQPPLRTAFAFAAHQAPLVQRINAAIGEERAFINYAVQRYAGLGLYRSACLGGDGEAEPLRVANYFALLALLLLSYAMALVVLLLERTLRPAPNAVSLMRPAVSIISSALSSNEGGSITFQGSASGPVFHKRKSTKGVFLL